MRIDDVRPSERPAAQSHISEPGAPVTVSAIICAYTERRWNDIVEAVCSLRQQSLPALEIILVVDNCPELLARAQTEFDDVTAVPNRRAPGVCGARNTALDLASGDVVAFLDDDAVAAEDWIARLAPCYTDPMVGGVGGRVLPRWRVRRPAWFPTQFNWVVGCSFEDAPPSPIAVRNFIGANMSFRRALLKRLGGFDSGLDRDGAHPCCEETEVCIRLTQAIPGQRLMHEPRAQVRHSVPGDRCTWRYFLRRCYQEGVKKAELRAMVGAADALSSERHYLSRTIPLGLRRELSDAAYGRITGIARAVAMVAGVAATGIGYFVGHVAVAATPARFVASGRGGPPGPRQGRQSRRVGVVTRR
jgi:glycosyltransferase involved in cell wall biosynthesis